MLLFKVKIASTICRALGKLLSVYIEFIMELANAWNWLLFLQIFSQKLRGVFILSYFLVIFSDFAIRIEEY